MQTYRTKAMNRIRRIIGCVVCLFISSLVFHAAEGQNDRAIDTPLVRLLANPRDFIGKKVRVRGYLVNRFEDCAIYLSKDDATYGILQSSVWVDLPPARDKNSIKVPKRGFVEVIGTFSAGVRGSGHMGMWPGELTNVVFVALLPK